jgi:hypothetical protein
VLRDSSHDTSLCLGLHLGNIRKWVEEHIEERKKCCDLFKKTSKKQASKHGGKSPLAGLVAVVAY